VAGLQNQKSSAKLIHASPAAYSGVIDGWATTDPELHKRSSVGFNERIGTRQCRRALSGVASIVSHTYFYSVRIASTGLIREAWYAGTSAASTATETAISVAAA
jgi:hypothetical protein